MKVGDLIRHKKIDNDSTGAIAVVIDMVSTDGFQGKKYPKIMWTTTGEIVHLCTYMLKQYEVVYEH